MADPVSGTILVVNAGSSSVKYALVSNHDGRTLASGVVERVGLAGSTLHHVDHVVGTDIERTVETPDHAAAISHVIDAFATLGPSLEAAGVRAVGHRVVMGGPDLVDPVVITPDVLAAIDALAPLAPLHNPANAAAIRAARTRLPDVPHVAVFDTAFFHDLPDTAAQYAIDPTLAERHAIRRYGFHGISHAYVSARAARLAATMSRFAGQDPDRLRHVVLHLGNGASASAVVGRHPVETSMGFTPLEGLVMGTRSGDIDPAVVFYLQRHVGLDIDAVDHLLNRASGLAGMAGSNDMRDIHAGIGRGEERAIRALARYVHRLRKTVGAYAAVMGGIDTLTFTAGVGENDPVIRATTVETLGHLGLAIDPARNDDPSTADRVISPDGAAAAVLVVPTREETSIARQTRDLLQSIT